MSNVFDKGSGWTPDDVRAFMSEHSIKTLGELSDALGVGRNRWSEIFAGAPISRTLALAMVGLSARLNGGGWLPPKRR
jgi:hypothetical protein